MPEEDLADDVVLEEHQHHLQNPPTALTISSVRVTTMKDFYNVDEQTDLPSLEHYYNVRFETWRQDAPRPHHEGLL